MIYEVRVKTGVKSMERVEKRADGGLVIWTHARAHDGEANKAVIALLAEYLKVPKSSLKIVAGNKNKLKKIELN